MNLGIEGKLALVVGASKGIGRAVARALQEEGCRTISVARGGLQDAPGSAFGMDMMEPGAPERLVEKIHRAGGSPDIIYHCMGGSWAGVKAWDSPADDYAKVWRFNLGVAIDLNRLLVPAMLERKWGRVVMTSTDATKCNSGNAPYTSSKFALEGYVKTVSKVWAPSNVILTAVAPGNVHTPGLWTYEQGTEWTEAYWREHVASRRWARPEEIASAILPLCGEGASWMPGSIVRVDGGAR